MFDSGANLFSELKSIFENGAASNGGSHPKTQKCRTGVKVRFFRAVSRDYLKARNCQLSLFVNKSRRVIGYSVRCTLLNSTYSMRAH